MKDLSIVIPTLNEEDYISSVLEALSLQKYQYKLQIIVVDGNSTDSTVITIQKYSKQFEDLVVICADTRGVSFQRNLGASHAKYDHLLFMDADVILPSNFLNSLSHKAKKEYMIALVMHLPLKINVLDYLWLSLLYSFIYIVQWYRPICSGSFLLTTRNNHAKVGGFDEKTVMGGDVIYGLDSIAKGARYTFFFYPYVFGYPRRLRKEGRLVLLMKWLRGYWYMIQHGPIYKEANLHEYEFGNYSKADKL